MFKTLALINLKITPDVEHKGLHNPSLVRLNAKSDVYAVKNRPDFLNKSIVKSKMKICMLE